MVMMRFSFIVRFTAELFGSLVDSPPDAEVFRTWNIGSRIRVEILGNHFADPCPRAPVFNLKLHQQGASLSNGCVMEALSDFTNHRNDRLLFNGTFTSNPLIEIECDVGVGHPRF